MHRDIKTTLNVIPMWELNQIAIEYTQEFKGVRMTEQDQVIDIYDIDIPLLIEKLQAALEYFKDLDNGLDELTAFSQDIGLYDI